MLNRLDMPAGDARELASAVRAELVEACASVRVCKFSYKPGLAPAGDSLSLASQKKVTCRRATPGQQANHTLPITLTTSLSRGYKC